MTKASLFIITYNQERFIKSALESAFAQTYGNLEIIISDDCSIDNTWNNIQALVGDYRGPHTIKINRNPANLGIVGNFNLCVEMSTGELLVAQAGDDRSMPDRVEQLMAAWISDKKNTDIVYSNYSVIYEANGGVQTHVPHVKKLNWKSYPNDCVILGAVAAYSKRIFTNFGLVPASAAAEDTILSFRAAISGGGTYVQKNLLIYTIHSKSLSVMNRRQRVAGLKQTNWSGLLAEARDRQLAIIKYRPMCYFHRLKISREIVTLEILSTFEQASHNKKILKTIKLFLTLRFQSFIACFKTCIGIQKQCK